MKEMATGKRDGMLLKCLKPKTKYEKFKELPL